MDLELLQSISVAVSQVRTVETVLKMIVDGLVEKAGFALARIWLIGTGRHFAPPVRWATSALPACGACTWRQAPAARRWTDRSGRALRALSDVSRWARSSGCVRPHSFSRRAFQVAASVRRSGRGLDCKRAGFRRNPRAARAAQTGKRLSPERSE